jgi:hypothetical protein
MAKTPTAKFLFLEVVALRALGKGRLSTNRKLGLKNLKTYL